MISSKQINEIFKEVYSNAPITAALFLPAFRLYPKYFTYGKLDTRHRRSRKLRRLYREYCK